MLEISGSVLVESIEEGNVYIMGAKSVRASGEGDWIDQGAWIFLLGWRGQLEVDGNECQIQLARNAINFVAQGKGRARIRGNGRYTLNDETAQLTPEFQEIELH